MGQFLFEFIFYFLLRDVLIGSVRFTGVCVLYFWGALRQLFKPGKKLYSIKELWSADFNKKDPVMMSAEKSGQIITGLCFIGVCLSIILY
ncbi:hypothetical protein LJ707_17930 [Mucilaginibacter sp. UR6-1]|uniref:hypothetical protein n=1 Tax=Mucilaginibacter sp. UR6-1 TaxID=1435643 RepID=UPI001E41ACD0|nr:hypothetical protein [Mucilaginibacter sp. UR6-1]MCC8410827.1 hypothetical protein [Mucilaginibacter sp. UR6-1]